jgi:hypothetical protein
MHVDEMIDGPDPAVAQLGGVIAEPTTAACPSDTAPQKSS